MSIVAGAITEAFVSMLLDGLTALVKDEVAMLWGVKGEIKRLQKNFQTIKAVLADAENKKIQDKAIDGWLKKLKDIMYDADDILDECRIEAEKSRAAVSSGRQPWSSCCSFWTSVCGHCRLFSCSCFGKLAFAHQIGKRIQDINSNLQDLWAEKSNLNLQLSSAVRDDHRSTSRVSWKTSPIPEPDTVGSNINKDTEKLVELLIKEDTREKILVYSIVGIGGIGKTTLARRIFNDARIAANFPMKRWVCVSKDFEETRLLKEIIGGNLGGDYSRAQLETEVENTVRNEKFLLVVDDLWDPKVWNDLLRNPLWSGATGSRVLVTTRNEGVAMQMKAVAPHHKVELLSAEDGWELLCKKVVLSGQEGEIEHLKDIGEEIVDKCGRLPLAINTIGGVLSTKSRTKEDWEKVLKTLSNNAWTGLPEGVRPALYLSYKDLPSHLKQCFLYCSLFPEDYKFRSRDLIYYWISEGFIHEEGDLTLEELGEDYYGDLVQRSFLQRDPWDDDDDSRCTVHDLLWSLARFLVQDENLIMNDGVEILSSSPSLKPRRLRCRVTEEKRQAFIDALEGNNALRTLLLNLGGSQVEENDVNNLIKKTPRLRVLDLFLSNLIKLPDSLGNLIHLRYLNVSATGISELPKSIGNLVNLQFLILFRCFNLRSLPKGIGKLHNLRCLDLYGTEVEGIPIEIANLHRLNTLILNPTCPQLPPLGKLPNLDYLWIDGAYAVKKIGTEFLGQEPDCDQGGRMQISFPKLTRLIIKGMENWEEWEWEVKDDGGLIALPKLKELILDYCPKLRSLPSGLVHHATTLTKLEIFRCVSLKEIRGFSSVKELNISWSRNLEVVSDLPSLKTLMLKDDEMRSLPEWFHGGQPDFPALNKLQIEASDQLLRRCLKDGLDWPKIEHIPYVYATNRERSRYISKSPSAFSTNIND